MNMEASKPANSIAEAMPNRVAMTVEYTNAKNLTHVSTEGRAKAFTASQIQNSKTRK